MNDIAFNFFFSNIYVLIIYSMFIIIIVKFDFCFIFLQFFFFPPFFFLPANACIISTSKYRFPVVVHRIRHLLLMLLLYIGVGHSLYTRYGLMNVHEARERGFGPKIQRGRMFSYSGRPLHDNKYMYAEYVLCCARMHWIRRQLLLSLRPTFSGFSFLRYFFFFLRAVPKRKSTRREKRRPLYN